jgi:hypothetical protein
MVATRVVGRAATITLLQLVFVVVWTVAAGPVPSAVTVATVNVYAVPGVSPSITRIMLFAVGWVRMASLPVTVIVLPSDTVTW